MLLCISTMMFLTRMASGWTSAPCLGLGGDSIDIKNINLDLKFGYFVGYFFCPQCSSVSYCYNSLLNMSKWGKNVYWITPLDCGMTLMAAIILISVRSLLPPVAKEWVSWVNVCEVHNLLKFNRNLLSSDILVLTHFILQGYYSVCDKPPIDFKTKVAF